MGKDKKEKKSMEEIQNNGGDAEEMTYEERLKYVSIISKPMAPKKLTKKVGLFNLVQFWRIFGCYAKRPHNACQRISLLSYLLLYDYFSYINALRRE